MARSPQLIEFMFELLISLLVSLFTFWRIIKYLDACIILIKTVLCRGSCISVRSDMFDCISQIVRC